MNTQWTIEDTMSTQTGEKTFDSFIPVQNRLEDFGFKVYVSPNHWCYLINKRGNAMSMTLDGFGSCPPKHIVEKWLKSLPDDRLKNLEEECDKAKVDYKSDTA